MAWLYRYESKGIQTWILDSNLLRDLAGGSDLIEKLTVEAQKRAADAGGKVMQATSGAMTAVFDDKTSVEKFAATWPLEVSLRAPGLQVVQAWVEGAEDTRPLFVRLAQARNRGHVADIEACPWVYRAAKSGLPAVPKPKRIRSGARNTALDVSALAKEQAQLDLRAKGGVVTGGLDWAEFEVDVDRWRDREGPVAVIHADGSGVGLLLQGLTLDRLAAFSDALRNIMQNAVKAAVEALRSEQSRDAEASHARFDGRVDARPVVSAGDDLTYIVPARNARTFVTAWLRALEDETARQSSMFNGKKLTGGAGVAIVHRKHPFAQAYELADTLCGAAKKAFRDRGVSVIAFRRITSSWVESVEHNALAWAVTGATDALDDLAKAAKPLPRGTLRNWLTWFEQGDARAQQLWERAKEVATDKSPAIWREFEAALKAAGADPATGALLPNGPLVRSLDDRSDARPTPVRDAIALRYFEKEMN